MCRWRQRWVSMCRIGWLHEILFERLRRRLHDQSPCSWTRCSLITGRCARWAFLQLFVLVSWFYLCALHHSCDVVARETDDLYIVCGNCFIYFLFDVCYF